MMVRCETCGEYMPDKHNCELAKESRALFEAAKMANSPQSGLALSQRAYELAVAAESQP